MCVLQDTTSPQSEWDFALWLPDLPKVDQRENLTLVQGLCFSAELPQAAHGSAAPNLSIGSTTEGRKAILALRVDLI